MDHHVVTVQPDQVVTDVDFGNRNCQTIQFRGLNIQGTETQIPPSGVTIYADLNNNDQWDEGEPKDVTRADDPEVFKNRERGDLSPYWYCSAGHLEMPYGAIALLPLRRTFCNIRKGSACTRLRFSTRDLVVCLVLNGTMPMETGNTQLAKNFEGVNIGLDLDS